MSERYAGSRIWYDAKGYPTVWIGGKGKKVHVLEWEQHNGPKPPGHEIHHRDDNKANFELSNLELLTHSDHQKVHAGWLKENGAWAKKPCTTCGRVLALGEFYPRKGYTPSANCKSCHCIKTKEWVTRNPDRRKRIALAHYYRSKARA